MALRKDIKPKFETNDTPSQGDFYEVFDSFVHKDEDKATIDMIDAGIDDEHYVTPALLRVGLQNAGVISGGSNLPFKEYKNNFNESSIHLERLPIESSVKVFKNGQLLKEGEDYTINYETAVITFPELVGFRNIEIDYWYKNTEPIPGNGTNYVDLTTNQTVGGEKTFNNKVIISGTSTAVSAQSISALITPTLIANNNGDSLIGVNISPNFITNGFNSDNHIALSVNGHSSFDSIFGQNFQLQRAGNGNTVIGLYTDYNPISGGLDFNLKGVNSSITIAKAGNVLIETTDNEIDKLQVGGSILATAIKKAGGTSSQFLKADGSVDSTAYAPLESPTFTGTISGITKAMVGLANADNTTDLLKPISTATQTALNLKANLASPTFTGTVILPSTTSIGSVSNTELSYVDGVTSSIQTQLDGKANNSGVLHNTGNESFTGLKSATNTGTSLTNGISLTNNGTGLSAYSLFSSNTSTGIGIRSDNSSNGKGIYSYNASTGDGIFSNNNGTGTGFYSHNASTGIGISSANQSTGVGIYSSNSSAGNGFYSNNLSNGTGINSTNQSTGIGIYSSNSSVGNGIYSSNSSAGNGFFSINQSTGTGIRSVNLSTGIGIYSNNSSAGNGFNSYNSSTGVGIYSSNSSTGTGITSNGSSISTGFVYTGQDNGTNTFTVTKQGAITGTSLVKSGGTSSQFLKADGSVDTNAYLPLTGGTISGSLTSTTFVKQGSTSDDILLGDGTTTSLAGISAGGSSDIWTRTGNDIQNNNVGHTQIKLQSTKQFQILNAASTVVGYIDENGVGRYGNASQYVTIGLLGGNNWLSMYRSQASMTMNLGNPQINQPFAFASTNYYGTLYQAGSGGGIGAEHSFAIGGASTDLITTGKFRISATRLLSTVPMKYDTDLVGSYDNRTLVDKGYVDSVAVLSKIDEGNGNGYRLSNADPLNFGNIGADAVDLSYSETPSDVLGATGSSAFAMGSDVTASNYYSTVFGYLIDNNGIGSFDSGFNLKDNGYTNSLFGIGHDVTSMNTTVVGQASNIISDQISDFNYTATKKLFVVGNGTIQNADDSYTVNTRSDALVVRLNGSVEAPSLTNALIETDTTGKALVTKEYAGANYTKFGSTAPSSATDTGVIGEVRITSTYVYYCIATNTWVRAALATW